MQKNDTALKNVENLEESIKDAETTYAEFRKKNWKNDEEMYELMELLFSLYWSQIHEYLVFLNTVDAEKKIRRHIKVANRLMTDVKIKTTELEKTNKITLLAQYLKLYEDLFALVAFRSLEHYAVFMEWDIPDDKKVWKYSMDVIGGIFHYAGKAILDRERKIKFVSKQMPTGTGKCVKEDTLVLTPNGNKQLKDINIGDEVYAMGDENNLVVRKITNKWNTEKSQIKITMKSGKELIISPEHRMFTQKGYIQAKDITIDDFLYSVNSKVKFKEEKINENELIFITGMIFDGHCKNPISFTKRKGLIFDEFIKACDNLGFKYSIDSKKGTNAKTVRILDNQKKPKELLEKYNLFETYSKNKELPIQFYNLSMEQKYKFIGIMFATDGYIPKSSAQCGITLSSEKLIKDIQLFLSYCGIPSSVYYKSKKLNNEFFDAWELNIPDEYFIELTKNCNFYDKNKNVETRIKMYENFYVKPYSNRFNYPKEFLIGLPKINRVYKQLSRNKTVKQEIFEKLANDNYPELQKYLYKDFVWEQIKSIEQINEKVKMVDIEVETNHNFIANGYVSHNSYSDAFIISWIFGYDINSEVIKIVGNPALVLRNTSTIANLMASKRFAKIFPYYRKFHERLKDNVMNEIFSTIKLADGQLTVNGSSKPVNLEVSAKDTYVDGIRGQYLFLDDITRSKDKDNIKMHDSDIAKFDDSWFKRKYDENDFIVFISGTTYSLYDILSTLIRRYSNDAFYKTDFNKYTHTNKDGTAIFIRIPKLDYDTDESLFPNKYSTALARIERKRDERTFAAMEQQMPLPPEDTPFFWTNLNTYKIIPEENRTPYCYATLDPARKGLNYVAMGIHTMIGNNHFLIDCIYQKRPMEELYDEIVEKISKHHIIKFYIENNTDTSLKKLITEKLQRKGIYFCEVIDGYSYLKKEQRIQYKETVIKNRIFYPDKDLYARSSQMGKYMEHIISFNYDKNNSYDDSIDCEALYAEKFIDDGSAQNQKSKVLHISKRPQKIYY